MQLYQVNKDEIESLPHETQPLETPGYRSSHVYDRAQVEDLSTRKHESFPSTGPSSAATRSVDPLAFQARYLRYVVSR
jgi:hypothetical protein